MRNTRLLDEIRETNLSYLLLAQQLIREDRAEATFRLGISEEVADAVREKQATDIAETYARDPKFYGGTYCVSCRMHRPVAEFTWDGTDQRVGS